MLSGVPPTPPTLELPPSALEAAPPVRRVRYEMTCAIETWLGLGLGLGLG